MVELISRSPLLRKDMGKVYSVKSRTTCKVCGAPIRGHRYRTYCSKKCRTKFYNDKNYHRIYLWGINNRGKYAPGKIRCLICGRWYRQPGTHIVQRHKITARQYREQYGFDVKRGQLSQDLLELKSRQVFENRTVDNLKVGRKFWFKAGATDIGRYKRSDQTLARLKILHSYRKYNKKYETISN